MSMNKIVLASNNAHKLDEFQKIFNSFSISVLSLKDLNIDIDIIEDGETFLENSFIKAKEIKKRTDLPVLADDSGLIIPDLNGEPGIYSARYSGANATDKSNRDLVLEKLEKNNIKSPSAFFVCALTFLDTEEFQVEGRCYGTILNKEIGENGFGYDPIFFMEKENCTLAEMSDEQKNMLSHRRMAIDSLIKLLLEKKRINL